VTVTSTARSGAGRRLLNRYADLLDSLLGEFVGSAQVGPYVPPDDSVRNRDSLCPYCDQPISRHISERTSAIGRLYCPPDDSVDR
jgi:hypothetical protein